MQPFLQRPNRLGGRNLGTLTSSGLNRPGSYPLNFNAKPTLTQDQVDDTVNTYKAPTPTAANPAIAPAAASLSPQPVQLTKPQSGFLDSIGATGVSGGRPVGSTGGLVPMGATDDANFQANFRPPQQTERANPLTGGGGSAQMEGTSVPVARPPFVQRGSLPGGQDALPSPIKETISEDDDIGRSMQGTFGRLRDSFNRNFSRPSATPASSLARAQLSY